MTERSLPFVLKRESNQQVIFEARHRIHRYEGYCLLFAEYPAEKTEVLLCRKLEDWEKPKYGKNVCSLFRCYPDEPDVFNGSYVPLRTLTNEAEAIRVMEANIRGTAVLQQILNGQEVSEQ